MSKFLTFPSNRIFGQLDTIIGLFRLLFFVFFPQVYTLSPTFRAEPSHSRFHLAEFLMLEAESVTMDTTDALCNEVEAIVRDITLPYLQLLSSGYAQVKAPPPPQEHKV